MNFLNKFLRLKFGWYLIIILLWIVVQSILYWRFGFNFILESKKYIHQAHFWLEHYRFSEGRYLFYSPVIFIIVLSIKLNIGLNGALIIIMLVNLFSYLYFFKALKKVLSCDIQAFLAVGFLLAFLPYQSWSLFLYTECFFYSSIVFLFSHLLLYKKMNRHFVVSGIALLILVILSRPLGILFIAPFLVFIFFHLTRIQKVYFFIAALFGVVVFGAAVQLVFTTTSDWSMQQAIMDQSIICGLPVIDNIKVLKTTDHSNQLYQLYFYVTNNFSAFVELAVVRLKFFFLMVREYYSPMHNLYLLSSMTVIYIFSLIGCFRVYKNYHKPVLAFILTSILLFAITVALQCDDYHNRFFLALMPLFVFLAIPSLYKFLLLGVNFFLKRRTS